MTTAPDGTWWPTTLTLAGPVEGTSFAVEGEQCDIWGLHRVRSAYGGRFGCVWTVTHLPSGRSFGWRAEFARRAQAVAFVARIMPLRDWDGFTTEDARADPALGETIRQIAVEIRTRGRR